MTYIAKIKPDKQIDEFKKDDHSIIRLWNQSQVVSLEIFEPFNKSLKERGTLQYENKDVRIKADQF